MSEAQVEKIKFEYKKEPEEAFSEIASEIKVIYESEVRKKPKYYAEEYAVAMAFEIIRTKKPILTFWIRTEKGDYRNAVYDAGDYLILHSKFEKVSTVEKEKISIIKLKDNIWILGEK